MKAALRYLKYAVAAPMIDVAVSAFPQLSRGEAPLDIINFAGAGNYVGHGDKFVANLVSLGNLQENQAVLEIGCGIGRIATGLHRRFGERLSYLGFDIVRYGITWCQKHFATRSQRYKFAHSNIYNSFYNPRGRLSPAAYAFPAEAASIDFVFASSVFTHMQPPDVQHYIRESARVLKPGGRVYFTCFILDEESERQVKAGKTSMSFAHQKGDCRVEDVDEPDLAVAYGLPWMEERFRESGLQLQHVERCSWRGTSHPLFYQDIVIGSRAAI
jgi:SAM-dependent methyltransferase